MHGIRATTFVAMLLGLSLFPPGTGAAKTTVKPSGSEVVITVPVDLIVHGEPVPGVSLETALAEFDQYTAEVEASIEKYWNDAFKGLPYFCFTNRLDVVLNVIYPGSGRSPDPSHHTVNVLFPEDKPTFAGVIYDPAADNPNQDTPSAYEGSLSGDFNIHWMDDEIFAHEFGHLLGLGDDYDHGTKESLPGREGTLMGKGEGRREIDRPLVSRINDFFVKLAPRFRNVGREPSRERPISRAALPRRYPSQDISRSSSAMTGRSAEA